MFRGLQVKDISPGRQLWPHPYVLIAIAALLAVLGLSFTRFLAIGPNYWDLSLYLDAAHRIANGQIPNVDFLTPAGPLQYYQFYFISKIFPNAHPLLASQWAILIIALPLFAILIAPVDRVSRTLSTCLTLPFLCFALLPLNTEMAYPAPGFDGYGIYNRHPALLLYILVAALLYLPGRKRLYFIIGTVMLGLFLTKITGFVSGALIIGYALIAGRLRFMPLILWALAVIVILAVLELASGLVTGYLTNLLQLASLNEGSFSRRFRPFTGNHLDIFIPMGIAALLLAVTAWQRPIEDRPKTGAVTRVRGALDSGGGWLLAVPLLGAFFEIQNTGSQEFIYCWPAALIVLRSVWHNPVRFRAGLTAALAFTAILLIGNILHRGLQTILASTTYRHLDAPELGALGQVSARPNYFNRAIALNQHYADTREAYRKLAGQGVPHSDILTAEPDFQLGWLMNTAAAARAIINFEINTGRRLETLYSIDFTDPFPFMLDRKPLRFVQIGLDVRRTLPQGDKRMLSSIASAHGILVPLCPVMPMRETLLKAFAPALEGRQRISLTPCWDLLIRNGSDFAKLPSR